VTTEHFVLQGARSATITESTGRANIFLATVSGALVALGLMATATDVGTAFYAFALVILPTLAFVGLVTFERALQSGIEDLGYARRIALLRGYYFDNAPEVTPYLLSVRPEDRLRVQGLVGGYWQGFRTVAGMVAVITSVLAGATMALAAALIFDHSLAAGLVTGSLVTLAALAALMRFQRATWEVADAMPITAKLDEEPL
jgi:RsiW-degrading membrane proteinase PrsW (M82 family)